MGERLIIFGQRRILEGEVVFEEKSPINFLTVKTLVFTQKFELFTKKLKGAISPIRLKSGKFEKCENWVNVVVLLLHN